MLHNETRKLLIQALNKTHNAKEVAEYFSVSTSTVYRLAKQMREIGSVEAKTYLRGRKPALSPEDIHNIDQLIQQQSDITIHEIVDRLQLHISDETVRKAVLKLGYVYKKKFLHALEQEHPQCTAGVLIGSIVSLPYAAVTGKASAVGHAAIAGASAGAFVGGYSPVP